MTTKNANIEDTKVAEDAPKKGKDRFTVVAALTKEQYDALEDYRWEHRIQTKGGVLVAALDALLGK